MILNYKCSVCNSIEIREINHNSGVICLDCMHVESFIQNTTKNENYTKIYRTDKQKDLQRIEAYEEDISWISESVKNATQILDIGCSSGEFTFKISEISNKDATVLGIDIDEFSISAANLEYQRKNLNFICDDIYKLDFSKFDLIIFRGTLQYFKDPKNLISHIKSNTPRSLELIILSLPNSESLGFEINKHKWGLGNLEELASVFSLSSIQIVMGNMRLKKIDFPYHNSPYRKKINDEGVFVKLYKNQAFYANLINLIYEK